MSRRQSVIDAYANVEAKIRDTMRELSRLWDEIDMSESSRLTRVNTAFSHITRLCDEMLDGEVDMVDKLKTSIREDMKQVKKMRNELELEDFERPEPIKDGSIALMRHLQGEVERLKEEFQRRHEEQKVLVEKICNLKKRLDAPFEFEHEIHTLFPQSAHRKYEKKCGEMEELLSHRYRQCEQLQTDMRHWETMAENVAEYIKQDVDLKELLAKNIDSDEFCFSDSVVDVMEAYHTDLKPVYNQWLEDVEFRWTERHQQLEELWEKCLVAPGDRNFGAIFEPSSNSEQELKRMGEECDRLEKKYASCRTVFELVDRWRAVWQEKLGIEEKRKQPDYYKKVNVLPDNKRERELNSQMPVLEREIQRAHRKYEEENHGEQIMVQGMLPLDYIAFVQEEHKRELKFELQLKKEEKTRLHSPQPARTPRTTQKRAIFRTPMSAAKMEPAAKKLNFDMELPPCMSPATSEMISFITPTRRHATGPKTSSPKEGISSRTTTPASKRAMTPSSIASSKNRALTRKN